MLRRAPFSTLTCTIVPTTTLFLSCLPSFGQIDIGATYNFTEKVSIAANINNVVNGKGVMSWAPAGRLVASLDRQAFTPAQRAANEDQLFNIITIQPRAFFLSRKVRL